MGWALTYTSGTMYGTFQSYPYTAVCFGSWTVFVVTRPAAHLTAMARIAPHQVRPHR